MENTEKKSLFKNWLIKRLLSSETTREEALNYIASNNENIHLAIKNANYKQHAIKIYDFLIENNFSVYWNYKYNLKKSISKASEQKAKFIVIVGEAENSNNKFILKNLSNGKQKILDLNNILDHIK